MLHRRGFFGAFGRVGAAFTGTVAVAAQAAPPAASVTDESTRKWQEAQRAHQLVINRYADHVERFDRDLQLLRATSTFGGPVGAVSLPYATLSCNRYIHEVPGVAAPDLAGISGPLRARGPHGPFTPAWGGRCCYLDVATELWRRHAPQGGTKVARIALSSPSGQVCPPVRIATPRLCHDTAAISDAVVAQTLAGVLDVSRTVADALAAMHKQAAEFFGNAPVYSSLQYTDLVIDATFGPIMTEVCFIVEFTGFIVRQATPLLADNQIVTV